MLTSLMGLSLDHTTYTLAPSSHLGNDGSKQQNLDAHLHTIRSNYLNFTNRFFDKPFTIIVDPSARAGATGEHSPCDALVPSIVAEYGIVEGVDEAALEKTSSVDVSGGWERLEWMTNDKIQKECEAAQARALSIIHDSDDSVLWFEDYGTDWIKGVGGAHCTPRCFLADDQQPLLIAKLTPDAYIQMVLQLAWYKTRGEFTATYETVLTRMFKHGRTETLRTLTADSRAWVLAMMDPQSSVRI
jgi:carnitine O-acetyltransferase